jgi:hypothetical protein
VAVRETRRKLLTGRKQVLHSGRDVYRSTRFQQAGTFRL